MAAWIWASARDGTKQNIGRTATPINVPPAFQTCLKSLRLFAQYVTMRYRCFLMEFDPQGSYGLHELILESMLSGKVKKLCHCLDGIQGEKHSFARLFKTPHYTEPENGRAQPIVSTCDKLTTLYLMKRVVQVRSRYTAQEERGTPSLF